MTTIEERLKDAQRGNVRESFTDDANALRLVEAERKSIRFVAAWNAWVVFDGRRWVEDPNGGQVTDRCRRLLRADAVKLQVEAAKESDPKRKSGLVGAARSLASLKTIRAAVALAATDPTIQVDPDDLDADREILTVANGTVDLKSGVLRQHDPDDLSTRLVDVNFVKGAESPRWEKFLLRVLPDKDVRDFVQTVVGYALTGHVREQFCVFLIGAGANGKTVFVRTLQRIFGDFHAVGRPDVLVSTRNETHPTYVARFKGARLVTIAELDQAARIDEAALKILTGGDRLEARRMREDPWEFEPTHKIVVMSNHKPKIAGTDEGIWRRIRLVPFSVTIPIHERDPELEAAIAAESDGVLAWAVEGASRYLTEGLGDLPTHVDLATASYRAEEDVLERFLVDEQFEIVVDSYSTVESKVLWVRWQAWASDNNERAMTRKAFGDGLKRKGLIPGKSGQRVWHGIRDAKPTNELSGLL